MQFASSPEVPTVSSLGAAGTAERLVRLSSDGSLYYDNGTEWVNLSALLATVTESGASVTIAASHRGKEVLLTNSGDVTLTLDDTATVGLDFLASYRKAGTGRLIIAAGGMTVRNNIWKPAQYSRTMINAIGTDEFLIEAKEPSGIVALADGANIATDCALGRRFRITLGGNRTLDNPTNPQDGFLYVWEFIQDGTGSRTITLGSKFAFGTDVTGLILTTTAGKNDFMTAAYNLAEDKFFVVAVAKGY